MQQRYKTTSGSGTASNGTATVVLLAAPASNEIVRVSAYVITVTLAAAGGSGIVSLKDGTTTIMSWDANSLMNSQVNLGESLGFPLSAGNALNLVVESAGVTQATANASAVGYICKA